ncbi:hypothetical protein QQS21_009936 [Conoideocrella luteorostrata]|uniref:Peptidase A1 domain-containing protein n=1 Tax=Conoideocrella luteorostrata TaxID=1105319 RepID=A0AAJ0CKF9_9HYPO|nr:hypothetical protein QQS21_009936 [Conoideocrella luteorostrata]
MHTQSLLVFLCTIFSLVSLSTADIQKRSFSIKRVPNPNYTGRNGPRALVKTYRKFNMALPQGLQDAMAAQEKKEAVAAATKRNAKLPFRPNSRSEASRRGLLDDLLNGLGVGGGKQNGKQNGKKNGNKAGQGNQNAGKAGQRGNNPAGNQTQQGALQAGEGGNQTTVGGGSNSSNNGGITGGGANKNNTRPANPGVAAGNSTKQVGTVAANPEKNDVEYISPVQIGGQTVNLDFDTGSSDLWVFSSKLDPAVTANHRLYDPTKSSFKAMDGAKFNITYGDGSGASGTVGTDVVDVGGAKFDAQAIQLASKVSEQFVKDQNNDGLMGLAFSKINTVKPQKQKTFFDNIKASLAEPVFAADLKKGAAGSYSFGMIDKTKFKGDLTWAPVNTTKGFWQFSSEKFAVNDAAKPEAGTSGGQAIADTGTTLILADAKIVEAYYKQVEGAKVNQEVGGITFPCNTKMPDLFLDVGNVYMAKVSGADINFAQVDATTCFGGVQPTPPGQLGIYGDIFFKSQFVVFNGGNNTLGMALHA